MKPPRWCTEPLLLIAFVVPAGSQRSLHILEPPDGAILNRHDGETTPEGLRVIVKGLAGGAGQVRVNGTPVPVRTGAFEVAIMLRDRETRIVAEASGGERDSVTVLWDRDSFPRYRFSTDDNIWFLRDIARNAERYRSLFENPYLAFWQQMHRQYGTKVHFNIYYQTEGFDLSRMPDRYRGEWQRNRDWIRLSFHARSNEPDRPYLRASGEQIRYDYRLVTHEIERFAGPELLGPVTTLHWGESTREGARALRDEGIRIMLGYFRLQDGRPSVSYYLSRPEVLYLSGRDYWKDDAEDIIFVRHDIVINTVALKDIDAYLDRVAADPHQSEVMELMIHEQYFYPDYVAYEPDYRERVERAIRWVTKRGYKPVFFGDGFLGTGKGNLP